MDHKLDNIDKKIIEMLQKNARVSIKEMAKEVSFPVIMRKSILCFWDIISRPLLIWKLNLLRKKNFILLYRQFQT